MGNISYDKNLYQDKEGNYHSLLDETLRLRPNQRMGLNCQKLAGVFSLLAESYRNAEVFLKHTLGEAVSHECSRSQVQRQGSNILKEEEHFFDTQLQDALKSDRASIPARPSSEPLYLEVDGTMIHLQCEDKIAHTGLCPGDEFMVETSLLVEHHYLLK